MPVATVVVENRHVDLKSLPEGWVEIKRMNHGEKLLRQDMTSKVKLKGNRKSKDFEGEIDLMRKSVSMWEFANLIVGHNLTAYINPEVPEEGERPLNLRDPKDVALIDGKIAEEIDAAISEFNNFEEDAD